MQNLQNRTRLSHFANLFAFTLFLGWPAHAATNQKVAGFEVTADWTRDGNGWQASGQVLIGNLVLDQAHVTLSGNSLTGRAASVRVELFGGCELVSGSADLGLAPTSAVLGEVPGAPVQGSGTYLYFEGKSSTSLRCAGLQLPVAGGENARFYVGPNDPSLYFAASGIEAGPSGGSLGAATRNLVGSNISSLSAGVSAGGIIPWEATVRNAKGDRRSMNAHLVLGGDVELKAGQLHIEVENGSQALRFNSSHSGIQEICVSGKMSIPGVSIEAIGNLDLPLGSGVACLDGQKISISAKIGGNAWDALNLPSAFERILRSFGNEEQKLTGDVNLANGNFSFKIPGQLPLGPWSVEGELEVANSGLGLEGKTDFEVGPLDFGGLDVEASFKNSGVKASAKGKADLPLDNAKVDADFDLDGSDLSGSADARVWGVKVDGDFDFNGYHFQKVELSGGFDTGPASGRLKVKVSSNKVDATAEGSVDLGLTHPSFDIGVSSKGCIKTSLVDFCL